MRFHSRSRRGAAAIEFAFLLPIIVVMLSGLLDFSWYLANAQNVMQAARDGARTGVSDHDDPVTGAKQGADWIHAASPLGCDPITVTQGIGPGGFTTLTVHVACRYEPLMGILGKNGPFLPDKIESTFLMYHEIQ